jgi:hypothetical protein
MCIKSCHTAAERFIYNKFGLAPFGLTGFQRSGCAPESLALATPVPADCGNHRDAGAASLRQD